jgi:hypothetical protein
LCSKKFTEQIKVSAYLTQLPEKKLLLEKLEKAIAITENNIYK